MPPALQAAQQLTQPATQPCPPVHRPSAEASCLHTWAWSGRCARHPTGCRVGEAESHVRLRFCCVTRSCLLVCSLSLTLRDQKQELWLLASSAQSKLLYAAGSMPQRSSYQAPQQATCWSVSFWHAPATNRCASLDCQPRCLQPQAASQR